MFILPARVQMLTALFGTTVNPAHHITLNTIIKTQKNAAITNPSESVAPDDLTFDNVVSRRIKYFCIGTGGINSEAPVTLAKTQEYETRLYNMVPFRCVPVVNDLAPEDRENYRMRRKETINGNEYYTYYLKKLPTPALEVITNAMVDYVPQYQDSEPVIPGSAIPHPLDKTTVDPMVVAKMAIDANDFKEYYRAVNGSLDNARLTEYGLVLANEKSITVSGTTYNEVFNAEVAGKVVTSPWYATVEDSRKTSEYELYA